MVQLHFLIAHRFHYYSLYLQLEFQLQRNSKKNPYITERREEKESQRQYFPLFCLDPVFKKKKKRTLWV